MIELCGTEVGTDRPLFVMAGPDVIESEDSVIRHAVKVRSVCERFGLPFAFKCSFDKANRTSGGSFRGPGLDEGIRIFKKLKQKTGVSLLTDVHDIAQVGPLSEVADILQVPAFLCRQTDLIDAVARSGRGVNLKKGQFMAPPDMRHAVKKAIDAGNPNVIVTERGVSFGYHNLVVDMRSFHLMREAGLTVCFDATHSVQLPSADEGSSGGERKFVGLLARCAAAAGIDALFTEVHEDPDRALCDGPCSLSFPLFEEVLTQVLAVREALAVL